MPSHIETTSLPGAWPSYRSPHRRRADAEAHAEGAAPPPILDHPLVPAGPPTLVEDQAGLLELIEALRASGRFAYDTEFIGESTFHLRFCVIQVATADRITLIDALAPGVDLLPFWELLTDPGVEVLVHAGTQDLEPVQRLTGKPPGRVFDTQIAAAFIGQPYPVSLSNLSKALLDADLGTNSKFSQWDRRPLTALQQSYAANDVRYLHLLHERVAARLDELGHTAKAAAECRLLAEAETYRIDPLHIKLKAKGGGKLNRREQAVVDALLQWRAGEARRHDVPVRAMVDDQTIVDLGKQPVQSVADVQGFKGLPRPVKSAYAETLFKLTRDALDGPLPKRKRQPKPLNDAARARLDTLWDDARAACEAVSISPSIAFTKRELADLVRAASKGKNPPESRLSRGWRRAVLDEVLEGMV